MTDSADFNDCVEPALQELLDSGDFDFEFRSYSGRGMVGKECLAIVGDELNSFELGFALGRTDAMRHVLRCREPHTDSLGHSQIFYWPRTNPPEEKP